MAQLIRDSRGRLRVRTWTAGLLPPRRELSLTEEARKCPQAVINRLMNEGAWKQAEMVMDQFLK